MTLAHSLLCSSSLIALALTAPAGCQVDKNLGDLDDDTTATDSASSGTSTPSTEGTEDTGAPALACPDNPEYTCSTPLDCAFEQCGGPLAEVDADGCLRPRCDGGQCPDGYTCVSLGDWGSCGASSWGCGADEEGMCGCGGTADCSESVSICVQDEEAPPAACNDLTDEASCLAAGCSAFHLAPRVEIDQASGTCSCVAAEPVPTCLWFPGGNQGGDDVITPYVSYDEEGGIRLLPQSYDETPLGWHACTNVYDEALCACAQALSCP